MNTSGAEIDNLSHAQPNPVAAVDAPIAPMPHKMHHMRRATDDPHRPTTAQRFHPPDRSHRASPNTHTLKRVKSLGNMKQNLNDNGLALGTAVATVILLSACSHDRQKATDRPATEPQNRTAANQETPFTVERTTNGVLSYQWRFNTNALPPTNR
jgi:hypothetical protein